MHFPFLIKIHNGELEKPVIFMRKHLILLMGQLCIFVLLSLFPLFADLILHDSVQIWLQGPVLGPTIILFVGLFEILVLLLLYSAFMDWYLDIWIVTDERIVDVNQFGVFGREIAELQLSKVQDVSSDQRGVFATMFNYGNIRVQSAGEKVSFEFSGIPHSNEVTRHILELAQEDMHWHEAALAGQITGLK